MTIGRGKYGGIAEELAERFKAKGIIIAIIKGDKGTGIELVGPALVHAAVPGFLEAMAKDLLKNSQSDAAAVSAGEATSARKDYNPDQSPELRALQIKYQDAIARTMLALRPHREPHGFVALANALSHHLLVAIRTLDTAGSLTPGAKESILKRFELLLQRPNPIEGEIQ